jgi:hypothetical protein
MLHHKIEEKKNYFEVVTRKFSGGSSFSLEKLEYIYPYLVWSPCLGRGLV